VADSTPSQKRSTQVTMQMSGRTALALRYLLPILSTALDGADDDGQTTAVIEQAVKDIDRALPADLRGHIDNHQIAEWRMDAIDRQWEAGVRPAASLADISGPDGEHASGGAA
jgi:hypothetical protein